MHWMHKSMVRFWFKGWTWLISYIVFSLIQFQTPHVPWYPKKFMRRKYRFSHVCNAFQQHHIYNICIGSTMMWQVQQPVHPLISPHRTQQHVVPLTALRSGHLRHRVGGFRWIECFIFASANTKIMQSSNRNNGLKFIYCGRSKLRPFDGNIPRMRHECVEVDCGCSAFQIFMHIFKIQCLSAVKVALPTCIAVCPCSRSKSVIRATWARYQPRMEPTNKEHG